MSSLHTTQRGAASTIAIAVIVLVLIGGGVYRFSGSSGQPATEDNSTTEGVMSGDENMTDDHMDDGQMTEGDAMTDDAMMADDGAMEEEAMMTDDSAMTNEGAMESDAEMADYSGEMLAGSADAPLLVFNDADYQKALASDKLIALYFYANWCPTCKAEFPLMEEAFNELSRDDVIGFRVNYNDNETNDAEEALAREFGVAYQHTKVFVKNGERVLKSPESWDKGRYLNEISSYAQ